MGEQSPIPALFLLPLKNMAKTTRGTTRATGSRGTLIQQSRGVSPSEKASFHEIEGAGRRHVRRPFFGLTDDDEEALVTQLEAGLRRQLE